MTTWKIKFSAFANSFFLRSAKAVGLIKQEAEG